MVEVAGQIPACSGSQVLLKMMGRGAPGNLSAGPIEHNHKPAEGIVVDSKGMIYRAEVVPNDLKKYVKQ